MPEPQTEPVYLQFFKALGVTKVFPSYGCLNFNADDAETLSDGLLHIGEYKIEDTPEEVKGKLVKISFEPFPKDFRVDYVLDLENNELRPYDDDRFSVDDKEEAGFYKKLKDAAEQFGFKWNEEPVRR